MSAVTYAAVAGRYCAVPPIALLTGVDEGAIGECAQGEWVARRRQIADPRGQPDLREGRKRCSRARHGADAAVRVGAGKDPGELAVPGPCKDVVDAGQLV